VPSINQVELHPRLPQTELRMFDAAHGIATEAWSPLARGALTDDPTVVAIADRLGRTPTQVVIAWHLAIGNVVIPKSVTPSRIAENFAVFDIALTDDDVDAISALGEQVQRLGSDPDDLG
jgi:diketogulonate reductase-like aldo/keto reductase